MKSPVSSRAASREAGLSLVELLIAVAIGLLLLTGLVSYFVNASENQREMQRSSQQIENGRYAMDQISQDLHLAGFYGTYSAYSTPSSLPDPCDVASTANVQTSLGLPIQGYQAGSLSSKPSPSTQCATYLTSANLAAGSDILVIKYLDPAALSTGGSATTATTALYAQTNPATLLLQAGNGSTVSCTSDAQGGTTTVTRKCSVPTSSDACATQCSAGTSPGGDIRQVHVIIYFVAPCSLPSGGGSTCSGSSDDGGKPIPTLKRLELSATSFSVVPVAEGVEYMKIEYGVDSSPTSINANTGLVGDGVPDAYTLTPALSDFANTVTVRVDMLVRNPERSPGYSDTKTYNLGVDPNVPTSSAVTIGPLNDGYRRHVYASEVRVVNMAGRKENP